MFLCLSFCCSFLSSIYLISSRSSDSEWSAGYPEIINLRFHCSFLFCFLLLLVRFKFLLISLLFSAVCFYFLIFLLYYFFTISWVLVCFYFLLVSLLFLCHFFRVSLFLFLFHFYIISLLTFLLILCHFLSAGLFLFRSRFFTIISTFLDFFVVFFFPFFLIMSWILIFSSRSVTLFSFCPPVQFFLLFLILSSPSFIFFIIFVH